MKRIFAAALLLAYFVSGSLATDYNGTITWVMINDYNGTGTALEPGNRFYIKLSTGQNFVVDRNRVGSLAYDQYFSMAVSGKTTSRPMWLGADGSNLSTLQTKTNITLTGSVYGLQIQ